MIDYLDKVFKLSTQNTSYWFRITDFAHLEHIYYGARLKDYQPEEPLLLKRTAQLGSSVVYDQSDLTYCLDTICLEWSGIGKGDYRSPPAEIKMPDNTFTSDFLYQSHRVFEGNIPMQTLPGSYGNGDECQTLEITMKEASNDVSLLLYYTVYPGTDVITRRAVLQNEDAPLTIRKLLSMCLDMPDDGFRLHTFDGGWIKEGHRHSQRLRQGIHVNSSTTGASSNRHNPGFLLSAHDASETHGDVYGFNLVYSGNHMGEIELSNHELVRVQMGINPYCFEWVLQKGERFETPEVLLSFSNAGYNGLSQNFHAFINNHMVRGEWKNKERPVLLNNWEAHFFNFSQGKLLRLARRARRAGVELFVLDDGWFAGRDSDNAGLGDYTVNRRKLPRGIAEFSDRIHSMGMGFGLWFEPEMINEDSELYRAHPEYALVTPGKRPARGRNQLVLDLCNPEVRDYIADSVSHILDTCNIDYVKWDFNRHISDACSPCLTNQGEFFHRYVQGLYDVLQRIFSPRPHILFESCSSGGNRFDAGMLCYSPQIWASDNTDPIERLKIQSGLSYLYPPSTMGAHVSEAPHQQTLRDTPLATRFNVAAFGCLGYELDLKFLSRVQRREIKAQIEFYKQHRSTLQYGSFWRGDTYKDNKVILHSVDKHGDKAVSGFFQTQAQASEGGDRLRLLGLEKDRLYRMETHPQSLFIHRFGGLVKHIMKHSFNPEGFILRTANRYFSLQDCVESYTAYGDALMGGIMLNNQFVGTHYNDRIRLLGDFGSNLYTTSAVD